MQGRPKGDVLEAKFGVPGKTQKSRTLLKSFSEKPPAPCIRPKMQANNHSVYERMR